MAPSNGSDKTRERRSEKRPAEELLQNGRDVKTVVREGTRSSNGDMPHFMQPTDSSIRRKSDPPRQPLQPIKDGQNRHLPKKLKRAGKTATKRNGNAENGKAENLIDVSNMETVKWKGDTMGIEAEDLSGLLDTESFTWGEETEDGALGDLIDMQSVDQDEEDDSSGALVVDDPDSLPAINDTDIDPEDFDAQIARCHDRIAQGYAKRAFELKIAAFTKEKAKREEIIRQYGGMEWNLIQRLETLKLIAAELKKINDPQKELVNVSAIIAAYEAGDLKGDGTTYWAQGKMLGKSKEIDWDMFKRLNTVENRADSGFWVEGIYQARELNTMWVAHTGQPPDAGSHTCRMNLSLQLGPRLFPESELYRPPRSDLSFLDDTGSDVTIIYKDDLYQLMGTAANNRDAPYYHTMGYDMVRGLQLMRELCLIVAVDINISGTRSGDGGHAWLGEAQTIPVAVRNAYSPNYGTPSVRTVGPWLRSQYHTATAPQTPLRTWVCDAKTGIFKTLPNIQRYSIMKFPFARPSMGVEWAYSTEGNGRWMPVLSQSTEGMVDSEAEVVFQDANQPS